MGALLIMAQELSSRLRRADRALQKERGGRLLFRLWPYAGLILLLGFVLDILLHLNTATRVMIDIGFLAYVLGVTGLGLFIMFVLRNSPERTARNLEDRDPKLGSSLINHLCLSREAAGSPAGSATRELSAMAVAQYDERLQPVDLESLADVQVVKAQAKRAAYWFFALLALLAIGFQFTRVEMLRFLDPGGDHPPMSLTTLAIVDPVADTSVLFGSSVAVRAESKGHRVRNLFLSFHPVGQEEAEVTLPMYAKGRDEFYQKIDSVNSPTLVYVHTRNRHTLSRKRKVSLILTPQLEDAKVTITPPDYTRLPPEEEKFEFQGLSALQGSEIRFELVSNRPLAGGAIERVSASGDREVVEMTPAGHDRVAATLVAEQGETLRFSLVDIDGHPSDELWESTVRVTQDRSPDVRITFPERDTFVSESYVLPVRMQADDDYGIDRARLNRGLHKLFTSPKPLPMTAQAPVITHGWEENYNLKEIGATPGDVIALFAEAFDSAPDSHSAQSQVVRVSVISEEEYNNFLREQRDMRDMKMKYDALFDRLQQQIDAQREVERRLEEIADALKNATTDEEREALQQELLEQLARQQEINSNLAKLADAMRDFVRDQPVYDIESDFARTLDSIADQLQQSSDQTAKAMAELGAPPSSGAGGGMPASQEDVEKMLAAVSRQMEAMGQSEEQAKTEVQEPLEDLSVFHELLKNLGMFEQLYAKQTELTEHLVAYKDKKRLARDDQLALKELADQERRVGNLLDLLEDKLRHDADAAEDNFPRGAEGARDLANAMAQLRLAAQARHSTQRMLDGDGMNSYALAEALRSDMESLFGTCEGTGSGACESLDAYLRPMRTLQPGQTFEQMMMSKKFGFGANFGYGMGMAGHGDGGMSGYSVSYAPSSQVLGGESSVSNPGPSSMTDQGGLGNGEQAVAALYAADPAQTDTLTEYDEQSRQTETVAGEAEIEPYRDIVDSYFKKITESDP